LPTTSKFKTPSSDIVDKIKGALMAIANIKQVLSFEFKDS
jgi:hypothetical protein